MPWTELTWSPPESGTDSLSGFLTTNGPLIRSALDEAVAAAILGPASIVEIQTAVCPVADLPDGFLPVTTFELLGTTRRAIAATLDPDLGGTLGGTEVTAEAIASGLLEAFDAVVGALVGEGIGLGPADGLPPDDELLLIRVAIASGTDQGAAPEIALVVALALAARSELATHIQALEVLSGASSPSPSPSPAPTPAPTPVQAPAPQPAPAAPVPVAVEPVSNGAGSHSAVPAAAAPIRTMQFAQLPPAGMPAERQSLDLLLGVSLEVSVEIGRTHMTIRDVLSLAPGSIVELDKLAGEKVDVLVNRHHVATGEVVVVDENFGVRVTEIVSRERRLVPFEGRA
jgi:flagellar motor switch protein FliN